jgi:hypothetical protein
VTGFSLAHLPMISGTCLPPTLRTTGHHDRHCIMRNEVLRTAHPDRRERPSSDRFWQNSEAIRPVNPRRQARHLAAANPGSHFSRPAAIRTLLIIDRASSPAFATDVLTGTRGSRRNFLRGLPIAHLGLLCTSSRGRNRERYREFRRSQRRSSLLVCPSGKQASASSAMPCCWSRRVSSR